MNKKESFRKTLILIQVGIAFSFLKSLSVSAQSCLTGYFSQNGVWTKWATSWYTCTNATEWETCYNKILNNSTKLWEFWPYGQFYSDQVDMWIDWKGSWRNEWGYQSEWYLKEGEKLKKLLWNEKWNHLHGSSSSLICNESIEREAEVTRVRISSKVSDIYVLTGMKLQEWSLTSHSLSELTAVLQLKCILMIHYSGVSLFEETQSIM